MLNSKQQHEKLQVVKEIWQKAASQGWIFYEQGQCYSETDCNIAILILKSSSMMIWLHYDRHPIAAYCSFINPKGWKAELAWLVV